MSTCWLNGRIMPTEEATIPVQDHGLLYGDGVFEGVRFYHRRPFRLQAHLDRLWASARAIDLHVPYKQGPFGDAIEELISEQSADDGYLRLVATRGVGPLGIDPRGCTQPNLIIIADRLATIPRDIADRGLTVILAAMRRLGVEGLDPRIRSLNHLNHIFARQEANAAGADEAILLNRQGRISEGSAENVFVVKGGCLHTPPVIDGALDGITRQVVLELADELRIPYRIESLGPYDLYTADEFILTSTETELVPVKRVDGRRVTFCPGPVFRQLRDAYRALINQETRRHPA